RRRLDARHPGPPHCRRSALRRADADQTFDIGSIKREGAFFFVDLHTETVGREQGSKKRISALEARFDAGRSGFLIGGGFSAGWVMLALYLEIHLRGFTGGQ